MIRTAQLRGHSGEVLCLETNPFSSLLLSGSEDGTARLWDLREPNKRTIRCFCVPNRIPVNAVAFGRNKKEENHQIFVAAENDLFCYDLRKPGIGEKVLITGDDYLCKFPTHKDEINQISVSPSGNYISVADDAGFNTVYSVQQFDQLLRSERVSMKPVTQFVHSTQDNIICTSTQFITDRQILTGGMDCTLAKWNYSKKGGSLFRVNFAGRSHITEEEIILIPVEEQQREIINPKFVYSIDCLKDRVAVGTGNGTVFIVDHPSGSISLTIEDIHSTAVSQVRLLSYQGNEKMITSGNDSVISLWNLPPQQEKKKIPQVQQSVPKKGKKKGKKQKNGKPQPVAIVSDQKHESEPEIEPLCIYKEVHSSKVNWMAVCQDSGTLFIADQSNLISTFQLQ